MIFNKQTKRLIEEWQSYGKIIVAVGFDNTIFPHDFLDPHKAKKLISLIKDCQDIGAWVVIHTTSDKTRYQEIYDYCKLNELHIDSINQNPISLPWGNETKVFANIFIDDRAGMDEAIQTLEDSMVFMRASRRAAVNLSDIG